MKINCNRCNQIIQVNRNLVNQKLVKFIDETGLYMCGICRRQLGLFFNIDATIEKLKRIKKENEFI